MGDLVRLDVTGLVPHVVSELGRKAERKVRRVLHGSLAQRPHAAGLRPRGGAALGVVGNQRAQPRRTRTARGGGVHQEPRGRGQGADDGEGSTLGVVEPVRLPCEQRGAGLEPGTCWSSG